MGSKEIGYKRLAELMGKEGLQAIEKIEAMSPEFADYILTFVYGDLYTRKALSDREKELISVTALISQKIHGFPLEAHVRGMLNVGWKQSEIIETIIFLSSYVGFPTALNALMTAQKVFDAKSKN